METFLVVVFGSIAIGIAGAFRVIWKALDRDEERRQKRSMRAREIAEK